MIALIVVALGAVVAAVGTGVLAGRSSRAPRIYSIAWTVAVFGLAVGLGAATLGYLVGYGHLLFRAMELGAQLIAPLSLCLALVELAGRRLPARFAMRLAIGGLAIIALVIMGTDPLNPNYTFNTKWADPTVVYQLAPLVVLGFLALFTFITALATIGVTAARSAREHLARAESRPVIMTALAVVALAIPGLSWLMRKGIGLSLPLAAKDWFAVSCVLAVALVWYAAKVAGGRDLSNAELGPRDDRLGPRDDRLGPRDDRLGPRDDRLGPRDDGHSGAGADWDDRDHDRGGYGRSRSSSYGPATGDFDRYDEPDSEIGYPGLAALAADPHEPRHRADPDRHGDLERYGDTGSFDDAGHYGDDDGRFGGSGGYSADGRYPAPEPLGESGHFGEPVRFGDDSSQFIAVSDRFDGDSAQFPADGYLPDSPHPQDDGPDHFGSRGEPAGPAGWDDFPAEPVAQGPLYGQITIYTLIEGRIDDFDRLTEWVVGQVQAKEPDTLVYIVHAVPTAPMQRILYEVYRSRAAHEEHQRRSYVMTFETEQRTLALAANVIELGLQQAKVSPLPSLAAFSELLSESGIDLTGVTRSSRSAVVRGADQYAIEGSRFELAPYDERHPDPRHYDRGGDGQYQHDQYGQHRYDQPEPDQFQPGQFGPERFGPGRFEPGQFGADPLGLEQGDYGQPPHQQSGYDGRYHGQPHYDQSHFDHPGYGQLDQVQPGFRPERQQPEQPAPEQPGPEQPAPEQPHHGGWAEIRGEDSRYQ
jgi:quinol monooxygenase YgiN